MADSALHNGRHHRHNAPQAHLDVEHADREASRLQALEQGCVVPSLYRVLGDDGGRQLHRVAHQVHLRPIDSLGKLLLLNQHGLHAL